MKKTTALLFLIAFISVVYSQSDYSFINKIYVYDNESIADTVFFGNHPDATTGIDVLMNETNIYGTEWMSPEIRSIQRLSDEDDCALGGWVAYCDGNYDLKTDIRKSDFNASPQTNVHFTFKIYVDNCPVDVWADMTDMDDTGYYFAMWSVFQLFSEDCSSSTGAFCPSNNMANKLFTIETPGNYYLEVLLDFENKIPGTVARNNKVYLSETGNYLFITNYTGPVEVFTIDGKLVSRQYSNGSCSICKSQYCEGLYIIRTMNGSNTFCIRQ